MSNTNNKCLLLLLLTHIINLSAQITFEEIAQGTNLAMPAANVESLAWGDYDNDGDQDLYLTINGNNAFMQNNNDGTFTEIIESSGAQETAWSVGTAFADFDNDGDLDLIVLNFGTNADSLFRNNGPQSNYTFTNVAKSAGLTTNISSSRGLTLIDFNRDGLIDIYLDAIGPNLLYQNMGNLKFVEVGQTTGVAATGTGVGAVMSDVDNNGWPDIFTGNRSSDPNQLYFNSNKGFNDVTNMGIDKVGLGMGVVAFDYDNDLDIDLYWTTWPGNPVTSNAMYENQGKTFVDVAVTTGTADPTGWGISANVADADNDGWQDLLVSNGFDADSGPNVLFHNQGRFGSNTFTVLDMGKFDGRGVAWADYDNDGDMDVMITGGPGAANRLYKNTSSNLNQWLHVELKATISNASAIGAKITINSNNQTYVKEVSGGAGRGSQNSLPVEFGLGTATQINSITVRWPNGESQQYLYDGALNRRVKLKEDQVFASSFNINPNVRPLANISSVSASGSLNNYTFNVGILSPDRGCQQYADWWEVLTSKGLIHRRILAHSHINEQPFIRSSGPVKINAIEQIWIRAHMSNGGYGKNMYMGSIKSGFTSIPHENIWDNNIEFNMPQVGTCEF